jgi:hypothetical protein
VTIHRVEQGSDAWRALRLGKATASRIPTICRKIKSGAYSADRANYRADLVLERLTFEPADSYQSGEMIDGQNREPDARAEYELRRRCEVELIGFVDHPTIAMSGASPDGFVGDDGLIDIKCPIKKTHFEYLRGGEVPSDYVPQIMWNFACNPDRKWCEFVSFHQKFPEALQLFVKRIERDEAKIAYYEKHVADFLEEVDREETYWRAVLEGRKLTEEQLKASVNLLEAS